MSKHSHATPPCGFVRRSLSRGVVSALSFAALVVLPDVPLSAAVVVLVNQTDHPVKYQVLHAKGSPIDAVLPPGEQQVVPSEEHLGILFNDGKVERRYRVPGNSMQLFQTQNDKLFDLKAVQLAVPPGEEDEPPPKPRIIARTPIKVPVKILADSAQPAVQRVWEKEFRERVASASKLFEQYCGASFEVVGVETWQSDGRITDFNKSLEEFQRKVSPAPAVVAIGFTSQYDQPDGQTHLGGTRGPMFPYVLAREWSQHVSKNERMEILAHELGHYLGAVHSGAADSLMRPNLGDRLANRVSFRIGFDPLNTLAMNVFTDELRAGPYRGLHRLPIDARRELLRIYLTLAKELLKDPAAPQYISMLNLPTRKPRPPAAPKMTLADATKTIVKAIADGADTNGLTLHPYAGDDLTEYYVGRAAKVAADLPPDVAADAFLLGLGIGLNDEDWVRNLPAFGDLCRQVESNDEFSDRVKRVGQPTLRKRHDLALHYMVSAALTAYAGPAAAEKAGLFKEVADSKGTSGFSFIDLTADLSGVAFAEAVRKKTLSFRRLADAFDTTKFLPEIEDLKEKIPAEDFEKKYGSVEDVRFKAELEKLKARVKELPGLTPPEGEETR
jgi:hypothetical protein